MSCVIMARAKDLTGQRFGWLTVIGPAEPYIAASGRKRTRWLCRCDCGAEVTVSANALTSGMSSSCGCARQGPRAGSKGYTTDLTGRRFGRLIVLHHEELPNNVYGKYAWRCRCDCGNETVVLASNLKDGTIKSCGCLRREQHPNSRAGLDRYMRNNLLINPDGDPQPRTESGVVGVYRQPNSDRWAVYIHVDGANVYCGTFPTLEEAIRARVAAEKKYFPEYDERT